MRRRFSHIPFSPARFPVFYGWPILAVAAFGLLRMRRFSLQGTAKNA